MHITHTEPIVGRVHSEEISKNLTQASITGTPDAFDGSAEPTIFMSDNRMPVMLEFSSTIVYIVFAALILALVFILPGVRKTKIISLFGLLTLLTVGASILLAIDGTHWLTGSIQINGVPYSSLTKDTVSGKLEVNIGLSSANVTLLGQLSKSKSDSQEAITARPVDYNERFHWDQPERMLHEHIEALRKGLPYPILTVTEFLSQDSEGFNWTRQLRQAGYYSTLALYLSLVSWCLTAIMMCAVPVYTAHLLQITGALMMFSVSIYTILIQSPRSFTFQLGTGLVEFAFGHTYVTTFIAGAMSMFAGVLIYVLQMNNPHKRLTIMDSDGYIQDHKVLYGLNLAITNDKLNHFGEEKKVALDSGNVIIPIADIEENFKTNAKST